MMITPADLESSLIMSVVWSMNVFPGLLIAFLMTAWIAGWPRDPAPDYREWTGLAFGGLLAHSSRGITAPDDSAIAAGPCAVFCSIAAHISAPVTLGFRELVGDATDDPLGVARMQTEVQLDLAFAGRAIDLCTRARVTFTAHLAPIEPSRSQVDRTFHIKPQPSHQSTGSEKERRHRPDSIAEGACLLSCESSSEGADTAFASVMA